MERKARKGFGGRPRKREPEVGDRVHLGIRVTHDMKRRLEEVATSSGRSQSQEAEYMLERSLDRSSLLGEVIELVYGRQTAGLLMALGAVMARAVEEAGENPKKENWALHAEAYGAAQHAAKVLLDLWTPKLRRAGDDWDAEAAVRTGMQHGVAAVEAFLGWLDEETKKPKLAAVPKVMLEFLGPMAAEMIQQFPRKKAAHVETIRAWDAYNKKEADEKKAKVTTIKKRA